MMNMMKEDELLIPWGKYKNLPLVLIIREHSDYFVWIMSVYQWVNDNLDMINQMKRKEWRTPEGN